MFFALILLSWQDFPYYSTNKLWNKKIYFRIWTKSPYQVLSSLCVHCPHQCPLAFHISFFLGLKSQEQKEPNLITKMLILWSSTFFMGFFHHSEIQYWLKFRKSYSQKPNVWWNYYMVEMSLIWPFVDFFFVKSKMAAITIGKIILLSYHWTIWKKSCFSWSCLFFLVH